MATPTSDKQQEPFEDEGGFGFGTQFFDGPDDGLLDDLGPDGGAFGGFYDNPPSLSSN